MKIFAFVVVCLMAIFFIVIPGIEEYNKHKDGTKIKALLYALVPLVIFVGMVLVGFVLFEVIPRIGGQLLDNIFR